jgi:hypothetical protein
LVYTVPSLRRPLFGGVSFVELIANKLSKFFFPDLFVPESLFDSRGLAVSDYVIISTRFVSL